MEYLGEFSRIFNENFSCQDRAFEVYRFEGQFLRNAILGNFSKTHRTTDELIFSGLTGKTLFDFDMKELNSIGVVLTWTNDEDVKFYESRFINEIGFGSIFTTM